MRAAVIAVVTTTCVALSLLVAGCSRFPSCLPAPMSVTPGVAHTGGAVTVGAPPADCDLGYGSKKTYELTLRSDILTPVSNDSASNRTYSVEVGVESNGSFTADIAIPEGFPPGPASIWAKGTPWDQCGPTEQCPGYDVELTIKH